RVRPFSLAETRFGGRQSASLAAEGWGPFEPVAASPAPLGKLPAVGRWPLLWKETLHGRKGIVEAHLPLLVLIAGVLFAAVVVFGPVLFAEKSRTLFPGMAILATAGTWCTTAGFRAAAGVSRERDKATLEGLLTLPVSRDAVLGAKWLGPVLY